ncbi:MAG TPA: ribonuclease PH [Longimicrobiales bacterium]|nr:ribonuclease PH [Longimicrobiales bacterium]
MSQRNGRGAEELRAIEMRRGTAPHAEGSCTIRFGRTEVLCTASVEKGVPDWRAGRGLGWVTAEYAMLPRATHRRSRRERAQLGGRTQEIQRLIGRSLRATVDAAAIGEYTILVDCDVLVADGGTRTAAITGAAIALHDAGAWLVDEGHAARNPVQRLVAAVSVGIVAGEPRLDLEYTEDVAADTDMNLVALEDGGLVEVQGTAEKVPFSRSEMDQLIDLGLGGIERLLEMQRRTLAG